MFFGICNVYNCYYEVVYDNMIMIMFKWNLCVFVSSFFCVLYCIKLIMLLIIDIFILKRDILF